MAREGRRGGDDRRSAEVGSRFADDGRRRRRVLKSKVAYRRGGARASRRALDRIAANLLERKGGRIRALAGSPYRRAARFIFSRLAAAPRTPLFRHRVCTRSDIYTR